LVAVFLLMLLPANVDTVMAREGVQKRVALVIGNAKYKDSPLANPVNDAQDMATALRSVGFQVIERTDASQKEMNRAITQFGEKLNADTVALFYYAGHGIQVKGKNYLVPVDAQITSESSIRAEAVDVDTLLDQLSASDLNVVILDACRNNPFERRFRSLSGGLAQMDAPKGSLIAYATAPGKTAIDGSGRNGVYTEELLRQIRTPGLALENVLKNVRRAVARATNDQQIPWESSSLTGDFYFNSGVAPVAPVATAKAGNGASGATGATGAPSRPADTGARPAAQAADPSFQLAAEDELWKAAVQANSPSAYQIYLDDYPRGRYAAAAKIRMAGIGTTDRVASKAAAAEPASPPVPRPVKTAESPKKEADKVEVASIATDLPGKSKTPVPASATEDSRSAEAEPAAKKQNDEVAMVRSVDARKPPRFTDRTYSGAVVDDPVTGQPAGKGVIAWLSGDKYEGEIKDGVPSGEGVITLAIGDIYAGGWLNGKRNGRGQLTMANGVFWEGDFKDDERVLTGQMTTKGNGVVISGMFTMNAETGTVTGTGKLSWANGDVYEGSLVDGIKSGEGTFSWANGQRYSGHWENDVPNGTGTITFTNGDRYDGAVRAGVQHGQGTYLLKSGDIYVGAWVGGNKHGQGRLTWPNGDYWEGEFRDDQQTKEGRLVTVGTAKMR
jgi:uncharacterized caspase-like protein